jgi:hypothetical protein
VSYIILRGRWCNIVVLNEQAPTEENIDDQKDSFCKELQQVFDHFLKYRMNILLGDFNAKLGTEDVLKPTIWNGRLHQDSNDCGVRIVKFAPSKKSCYARRSLTTTFKNTPEPLLMGRLTVRLITYC